VSVSSAILGGSPAHQERALAACVIGLALGALIRRTISARRLYLSLAWICSGFPPFSFSTWLEPASALHPLAGLTALALAAIPAGVAIASLRLRSAPSLLAGSAAGFALCAAAAPPLGAAPLLATALLLGLVHLWLEPVTPLPASDEQPPRPARLPRLATSGLALLLGAMWPLTLRPLELGWTLPPEACWVALASLALSLAVTLALGATSRGGPAAARPAYPAPLLLALSATGLTLELFLLPRLVGLEMPLSGGRGGLLSASLIGGLWMLQYAPPAAILRRLAPGDGARLLATAAVGSLLTSHFAVPLLSTEGALRACAATLFLAAALATLHDLLGPEARSFPRMTQAVGLTALAGAPLFAPIWDPPALLGLAPPAVDAPRRTGQPSEPVRFTAEDAHGLVIVDGQPPDLSLFVQRTRLYGPRDEAAEAFAGALPPLLHSHARTGLVVGAGAGLALDAARREGLDQLVWLAPSALQAGILRLFGTLNHQVLIDPKLAVQLGALRPFSRSGAGRFDVVTVLETPASSLQARGLYTVAGLDSVRRLLAPHGIAAIEMPLDGGAEWLIRTLTTFRQVFPGGLVWLSPASDRHLVLTGSTEPMTISYKRLKQAFAAPGGGPDRSAFKTPMGLLGQLLLPPEGLASLESPPLTDGGPSRLDDPDEAASPISRLQAALRPLDAVVKDIPQGPEGVTMPADLERIVQRHRAFLSMLGHLEQGVYTSVIDEARKVQALAPQGGTELDTFTRPYLARAERYLEEGRLDRAIEQLSVVRLIHPSNPEAPRLLGRIYEQKGQKSRAIELYQEVLRFRPDSTEAALALANLYREDRRLKEAAALLEDLATRTAGNAVLYHNLGSLYLALEQLPRARERFEQSIRLDGRLAGPHAGLAEIFFQQGRLDVAQEEADIAVRLSPTAYSLNLQGQIALRRGDAVKARLAFVQCLLKDPDFVEARGAMGILYAEAGDEDKAREAWEAVLQVQPDNRAAKENLARLKEDFPSIPRTKAP
jgi:tetratricopeptide (TPR) repeat protein